MKKMFLALLLTGATLAATAQTTTREVKGAVIDKNGNPLSGAKVEATGGAESTVTDADGTFSLEVSRWLKSLTATYPGMTTQKKSIRNQDGDILFSMDPKRSHWFVNLEAEYNAIEYGNGALGLMVGKLGNSWGFYGKFVYDLFEGDEGDYTEGGAITFGAIKRIVPNVHWYLGVGPAMGYGYNEYYISYGGYYGYTDTEFGLAAETGAILNFGHFSANLGLGLRVPFDGDLGGGLHIGLGYCF